MMLFSVAINLIVKSEKISRGSWMKAGVQQPLFKSFHEQYENEYKDHCRREMDTQRDREYHQKCSNEDQPNKVQDPCTKDGGSY
jgi:hypothetical protein